MPHSSRHLFATNPQTANGKTEIEQYAVNIRRCRWERLLGVEFDFRYEADWKLEKNSFGGYKGKWHCWVEHNIPPKLSYSFDYGELDSGQQDGWNARKFGFGRSNKFGKVSTNERESATINN